MQHQQNQQHHDTAVYPRYATVDSEAHTSMLSSALAYQCPSPEDIKIRMKHIIDVMGRFAEDQVLTEGQFGKDVNFSKSRLSLIKSNQYQSKSKRPYNTGVFGIAVLLNIVYHYDCQVVLQVCQYCDDIKLSRSNFVWLLLMFQTVIGNTNQNMSKQERKQSFNDKNINATMRSFTLEQTREMDYMLTQWADLNTPITERKNMDMLILAALSTPNMSKSSQEMILRIPKFKRQKFADDTSVYSSIFDDNRINHTKAMRTWKDHDWMEYFQAIIGSVVSSVSTHQLLHAS